MAELKKKRREFTDDEITRIDRMRSEGKNPETIAHTINAEVGAVRYAVMKLAALREDMGLPEYPALPRNTKSSFTARAKVLFLQKNGAKVEQKKK